MNFSKLILIAFTVLFSLNLYSQDTTQNRGYKVKLGEIAPDFRIEFTDGTSVQLSELRGKLVMLQFTASWCGVCRKEMPYIEHDIWQKHKDNPSFALFGIDLKESKEVVDDFKKIIQISYPLTLDINGDKFALYTNEGAGVTRNIIIGKDGRILMLTRLYDPLEFSELTKFIDSYLENE